MELIVALVVIGLAGYWIWHSSRPKSDDQSALAPYKVEPPQTDVDAKASTQTRCGCGRSQTGFCVGLHSLKPEEWAVHADNPAKAPKPQADETPAEKPTPKARKPRAKKTAK